MKALIQRVRHARVEVAGEVVGAIDQGLLVLVVLLAGTRDLARVLRVLGSVAAAMVVAAAVLTLGGARLSLVHLIALQLVAGVGLDYALFFSRRLLDAEEREGDDPPKP